MTIDRRRFLGVLSAAFTSPAFVHANTAQSATPFAATGGVSLEQARSNPLLALRRLQEGNARYARGQGVHACATPKDFALVAQGQTPFAAIVACADSRTAPETIFDQGIGEIFSVRTAGNLVVGGGSAITGSLEYAVAALGVSVVLLLGHSGCGAMKAALAAHNGAPRAPGDIGPLLDLIQPAVEAASSLPGDPLAQVTAENVRRGVARLRELDPILRPAAHSGKTVVVGAVHDLATGRITVV
nr:carbonic anhydrase [Luteibacter rhizovicinus]